MLAERRSWLRIELDTGDDAWLLEHAARRCTFTTELRLRDAVLR